MGKLLLVLVLFCISVQAQESCWLAPTIIPISPNASQVTVSGSLLLKFDAFSNCLDRAIHAKAALDVLTFPPCLSTPTCIGTDETPPGPYAIVFDTTRWSNGLHYVTVEAYDQFDANHSYSFWADIQNPSIGPDTQAPEAWIQLPIDGDKLGNGQANYLTVTGSYADNFAVVKVDLLVNGEVYATVNQVPWAVVFTTKRKGTYQLQTRAWDASANSGLSQVVTISK